MIGDLGCADVTAVETYELFCHKLKIDSSASKSCQIFSTYLRYGRMLSDDDVRAALVQIKRTHNFGACA